MRREKHWRWKGRALILGLLLSLMILAAPVRAAQGSGGWEVALALKAKAGGLKISYRTSNKRFYVKDANGKLLKEAGLYVIAKQSAGGVSFPTSVYYVRAGGLMPKAKGIAVIESQVVAKRQYSGNYYFNNTGRLLYSAAGLSKIKVKATDGTVFDGYYYLDRYSKLAPEGSIRRIKKGKLDGIYYFGPQGKMDTSACVRKLNTTLENHKYNGYYCFAGTNGGLTLKKGLVSLNGKYYYVANTYGRVLINAEKTIGGKTYTFGADGSGKLTVVSPMAALKDKLQARVKAYDGSWSVYVKNLDSGETLTLNNKTYYAASLVKPFLLACLYDLENQGKLKLEADDEEMCRYMITVSDNNSFNELMYLMGDGSFSKGTSILRRYLKENGYTSTQIHHSVQPSYLSFDTDGGGDNATNAKDCAALLEKIYRGTCVSRKYSNRILKYLLAQERTWKIPAGVPSGVKVANKTGETDSYDHDIAIVYGPKCTYILCVLSGYDDDSEEHVVEISRMVYNALNP